MKNKNDHLVVQWAVKYLYKSNTHATSMTMVSIISVIIMIKVYFKVKTWNNFLDNYLLTLIFPCWHQTETKVSTPWAGQEGIT